MNAAVTMDGSFNTSRHGTSGVGGRVTRDGEGNGVPLLWRDAGMARSLSGGVGLVDTSTAEWNDPRRGPH